MPIQSSSPVRSRTMMEEWRAYFRFMKWPVLPWRTTGFAPPLLRDVAWLYVLDILLMTVLVTIGLLIVAIGFEFPENALAGIDWTIGWVLLIVLGAPVYEELAFRSWLSGKPAHLAAFIAFIAGFVLTTAVASGVGLGFDNPAHELGAVSAMSFVVALVLAAIALWRLPKTEPFSWFARLFPLFFALSSLAFAAIHLLNYEDGALKFLLPLVIPQLIAGTIFGFARVRYGLWANILLHAMHNGTAMLIIVIANQFAAG